MTAQRCEVHGQPLHDAMLCRTCVETLTRDLGDLPALFHELDVTLTKQAVMGGGLVGDRTKANPLPFNTQAANTMRDTHRQLRLWVFQLRTPQMRPVQNDPVALARWLHSYVGRLAQHPLAVEIAADVHQMCRDLRHATDLGPDRLFAGPCAGTVVVDDVERPCMEPDPADPAGKRMRPTEMSAVAGKPVITCRRCGTRYDADERRQWLLEAAQDQLAHAELIGRAAPALGVDITPAAVRGYADRGRIVAHGLDVQGRPLYRLGDVIDVARDVLAKRAQRAQRLAEERERKERARKQREAS